METTLTLILIIQAEEYCCLSKMDNKVVSVTLMKTKRYIMTCSQLETDIQKTVLIFSAQFIS